MARDVLTNATRSSPFPLGTAAGLAGLAALSTALPDWVPDWRRRWPLQAVIIGTAGAVFALRPEEVAPGTLAGPTGADAPARADLTTDDRAPAEPVTTTAAEGEQEQPSPVQGLDQPDIPWSRVLLPGVVLLAGGAAGGLWLERQAIALVERRGVTRPRTLLAVLSLPLAWWSLRQDLSEGADPRPAQTDPTR